MSESPVAALLRMRRARQRHRLVDFEWFDVLYRVYVVGLFGGIVTLWLSGLVGDDPLTPDAAADVARHGPAVLGFGAAFAFFSGIRSGAQGGPMALEAPDVAHVMMAPIDRRRALMRPAVQRLRSGAASGAVLGAIAGQLAGRRLPGSIASWALGGAAAGAAVGLLWVGSALVAHALRPKLWIATLAGLAALAWQGTAVAWRVPAPGTQFGDLAMWGWRQHPSDLVSVGATVAIVLFGLALLRRTSLDALARRSGLVAQLRFAVTMQDLRTVILLRRQLNMERTRRRPWARFPGGGGPAWRRGWHSLLRLPASRLMRMLVLAAAAGVMQGTVMRGTSPALLAAAVLLFVLGLEVTEPLSQEVDQPDRADSLPIARGVLMLRHLAAPAVALLPFAAVEAAALTVTAAAGHGGAVPSLAVAAGILAWPTLLAGAAGAAVSIVRDAPDPLGGQQSQALVPPEMAGIGSIVRIVVPVLVSGLGASTVLLVREAARRGDSLAGAAVRGGIGALLVGAAVAVWVRKRDDWRNSLRGFMDEGRAYTAGQGASR